MRVAARYRKRERERKRKIEKKKKLSALPLFLSLTHAHEIDRSLLESKHDPGPRVPRPLFLAPALPPDLEALLLGIKVSHDYLVSL